MKEITIEEYNKRIDKIIKDSKKSKNYFPDVFNNLLQFTSKVQIKNGKVKK